MKAFIKNKGSYTYDLTEETDLPEPKIGDEIGTIIIDRGNISERSVFSERYLVKLDDSLASYGAGWEADEYDLRRYGDVIQIGKRYWWFPESYIALESHTLQTE